jgi:thymidylate synthase
VSTTLVEAATLGAAWLALTRRILEDGVDAQYDGEPVRELALATVVVASPSSHDRVVSELGDPEWLAWMRDNFGAEGTVRELGDAASYASRLFDYAGSGLDQIAWVVERLRIDPESRSATVTTFQPLTDTSYVPCVSMLDFWRPHGPLELVAYAHSLDFGKKAYGNLVELARLQERVAAELDAPVGRLVVHVKSAHVYEPEQALMTRLVATSTRARAAASQRA